MQAGEAAICFLRARAALCVESSSGETFRMLTFEARSRDLTQHSVCPDKFLSLGRKNICCSIALSVVSLHVSDDLIVCSIIMPVVYLHVSDDLIVCSIIMPVVYFHVSEALIVCSIIMSVVYLHVSEALIGCSIAMSLVSVHVSEALID
jgi:hypothetical protein